MIDVASSPHFRAATRYAPLQQLAGAPFTYLCVYEIEEPYSPELHKGVMHWLTETPDDFRLPMPDRTRRPGRADARSVGLLRAGLVNGGLRPRDRAAAKFSFQ